MESRSDIFERSARVLGGSGMEALSRARVMVVGVGGVGSVAAECLARTGVGRLVLVDPDVVCESNVNRQIPALSITIGRPKAEVMAERLRLINPAIDVLPVVAAYTPDDPDAVLGASPDYVIDAIDSLTAKCHLIATCRERGLRIVVSTGSAGRVDPTRVAIADLSETDVDPLAKMVRKLLRRRHGFPRSGKFGIKAVYSTEDPNLREGIDLSAPRGSLSQVTGVFGLFCASVVINALAETSFSNFPLAFNQAEA